MSCVCETLRSKDRGWIPCNFMLSTIKSQAYFMSHALLMYVCSLSRVLQLWLKNISSRYVSEDPDIPSVLAASC